MILELVGGSRRVNDYQNKYCIYELKNDFIQSMVAKRSHDLWNDYP